MGMLHSSRKRGFLFEQECSFFFFFFYCMRTCSLLFVRKAQIIKAKLSSFCWMPKNARIISCHDMIEVIFIQITSLLIKDFFFFKKC